MYRGQGKLYKTEAIILSRKNYGEADRILTAFTKEHGKIRCIAKGVRRVNSRRAPHLEIFTHCRIVLHRGKTLDSVTEVYPIHIFEHIRGDLERVGLAYLYCELVAALLADFQQHADVYDLLLVALTKLNTDKSTRFYESREFTLELLWTLGFLPRTKRLAGAKLQAFVESVAERHLRSPKMVRRLL